MVYPITEPMPWIAQCKSTVPWTYKDNDLRPSGDSICSARNPSATSLICTLQGLSTSLTFHLWFSPSNPQSPKSSHTELSARITQAPTSAPVSRTMTQRQTRTWIKKPIFEFVHYHWQQLSLLYKIGRPKKRKQDTISLWSKQPLKEQQTNQRKKIEERKKRPGLAIIHKKTENSRKLQRTRFVPCVESVSGWV